MAPLIYPEPTWSNRFGRVVRTLQIVAVAGAIGAVGGGVAVMALVGGGSSSRPPTALKVSTADSGKAGTADHGAAPPAGAAPAVSQPAAVTGTAQVAEAAAAAAEAGTQQQAPAAEPASNAAATEQHPVEQAAAPANSAAGTNVYDRVDPVQKTAPAQAPRARAKKVTRRTRNAERGRYERGEPNPAERETRYYSAQRGVPYPDDRGGPYSGERYSYRNYDPPPRGYYFGGGGGGFYDRGGWGD